MWSRKQGETRGSRTALFMMDDAGEAVANAAFKYTSLSLWGLQK